MQNNRCVSAVLGALLVFLVSGAAVGAEPATGHTSWDGLVELQGTRSSRAWIMPDVDLRTYTKMRIEDAGIHYRPVKKVSRTKARSGRVKEFPVSDRDKAVLEKIASEAFSKELAETARFDLVETNGPDTIIVRGALLDVVSRTPPDPIGGDEIYISVFGEALLALEIADSMSGTVIARAVDRRAAQSPGGYLQQSNSVQGNAAVRRLMNSWARQLREVLDDLDAVWDEL